MSTKCHCDYPGCTAIAKREKTYVLVVGRRGQSEPLRAEDGDTYRAPSGWGVIEALPEDGRIPHHFDVCPTHVAKLIDDTEGRFPERDGDGKRYTQVLFIEIPTFEAKT